MEIPWLMRSGTDEADIVMISSTDLLADLLVLILEPLEESEEFTESKLMMKMQMVAMWYMIATNNPETNILTVTKNGMAKRSD